jgi:hypothetical protein
MLGCIFKESQLYLYNLWLLIIKVQCINQIYVIALRKLQTDIYIKFQKIKCLR